MRKILLLIVLLLVIPLAAQGAPEAINAALADFNQRLGTQLTLNDFAWSWSESGYTAPCADATPVDAPGYQFLFTWDGQVYDYRVTADSTNVVLCSIVAADAPQATTEPVPIDPDDPPYTNPLCPVPPPEGITYMRTRLAPEIQARVAPGLPNNLRNQPDIAAAEVGQIPAEAVFTVLSGPSCDDEGRLWWEVDFDGLVGWTAEGQNGDYFLQPVPGAELPVERGLITAGNAEFLTEVARLEANLGGVLAFQVVTEDTLNPVLAVPGAAGTDGLLIYDLAALDEIPRLLPSDNPLTGLDFATSNPNLPVIGGTQGNLRLWNITSSAGTVERVFLNGHDRAVSAIAYRPDGIIFAASGGIARVTEQREDNLHAILLWEIETVSQVAILRGHNESVTSILFPAENQVISGSLDGTVRWWSVADRAAVVTVEVGAPVLDLAFINDGTAIAVALTDGTVLVLDAASGEQLASVQASGPVTALATNGEMLATALENGAIEVWSISDILAGSAAPVATLTGHTAAVTDIAFHPDSTLLVSLGGDNAVRWWSVVQSVG